MRKRQLYKFQTFSSFSKYYKESYAKNIIHFSQWNEMNDPLEGFFRVYIKENIFGLINEKQKIKIVSLTSDFDNFPMWAYYGSAHKGICLEYTIMEDNLPNDIHLKEIEYQEEFPKFDNNNLRENAIKILSTKLSPWENEHEIRLLSEREEQEFSENSIQLTAVILGALAGKENTMKFRKIQKDFLTIWPKNSLVECPVFYQAKLLPCHPYLTKEKFSIETKK